MPLTQKARAFWPLAVVVLLSDCASKRIAETALTPAYHPYHVLGDLVRLTLAYNQGAAMSLSLGSHSRLGLSLLALLAVFVMGVLYRRLPQSAQLAAVGLALIAGGALGNAIDRLRSSRGVVDFIDVGIGGVRFWTFNLADIAIIVGAVVLALTLGRTSSQSERIQPSQQTSGRG